MYVEQTMITVRAVLTLSLKVSQCTWFWDVVSVVHMPALLELVAVGTDAIDSAFVVFVVLVFLLCKLAASLAWSWRRCFLYRITQQSKTP
jgi:hypothetical protein